MQKAPIMNRSVLSLLSSALAGMLACTSPGGIGHEGEAKITGQLLLPDGNPAVRAEVVLFPAEFDPVADSSAVPVETTDEQGNYRFFQVSQGEYSILAIHSDRKNRTLIHDITVSDSTVTVPSAQLQQMGSMKVFLPTTASATSGYVYIPGTSLFVFLESRTDYIVIDSVPAGEIPQVVYSSPEDDTLTPIRYNIPVISNDTAVVRMPTWKHTGTVTLNTSSTGADVAGDVTDCPVLLRLRAGNFDFSRANEDGGDIRFTKADGTPLPYEIERYDAAAEIGDIWVKVDTVYAYDTTQSIMMYWGNTTAADASNGAAVFDTSDNYTAVWHLNKNSADATANHHDATAGSATDTTGIIGACKKFNGSDSIKIDGLLDSTATVTLSAWAQLDSTSPDGGSEILSIGDAALIRMDYTLDSIGTIGSIHLTGDSSFFNVSSERFLKRTGWHLITYTIDNVGSSHTLYIDGAKVASRADTNVTLIYSGVGRDTYIGKHGNGKTEFGFIGMIDEVRVYRTAVSADYIKLCYMNQKENDLLVVFNLN